jgi:hypothetical protein
MEEIYLYKKKKRNLFIKYYILYTNKKELFAAGKEMYKNGNKLYSRNV